MIEYFEFLPYGKYAFFIWGSYVSSLLGIMWLFYATNKKKKKIMKALKMKYIREM